MDFFNYFKRFLGLGSHDQHQRNNFENEQWSSFNITPNEDDNNEQNNDIFSFEVFTNPLHLHSYFEHKMNEIMRQFGAGDSFFFNFSDQPMIEDGTEQRPSQNLRDEYLKPGYRSTDLHDNSQKTDADLDGQISSRDLDTFFKDKDQTHSVQPVQPYQRPFRSSVFGQSVISKTIQKPDGTFETHRTVKNSDGTEETTITKKQADKEYTVTVRRDKDGKEERTETIVNLDEKDVSKFISDSPSKFPQNHPNFFDFDRFFK